MDKGPSNIMAKYSRFDPRNRKYGRNKNRSLDKDLRIKQVEHNRKYDDLREVTIDFVNNEEYNEEK